MNNKITIHPTFPLDETIKAQLKLYFTSWSFKRMLIYLVIMLVILGINVFKNKNIDPFIALGPLFILILVVVLYFLTRNRIKKAILANPRLKEKITFTFSKDAFIEKGETFEVHHEWSEYQKIKETKDYFFLYANTKSAIILKKEDFKNQLSHFKKLTLKTPIKANFKLV